MNTTPSVIQTGDFLYFAPIGKAFTVPAAGVVSASALPGSTDAIWTTYGLGTVRKPGMPKRESKAIEIKAPKAGTGIIVTKQVVRPERSLSLEVEMNEMSRTALAGFYQSDLIEAGDTSFIQLAGPGSLMGWLQWVRADSINGNWVVENWWVDLDVTDLAIEDTNVICPKFKFTWLDSTLASAAI